MPAPVAVCVKKDAPPMKHRFESQTLVVLGTIGSHYRLSWLSEDDPKNTRRETTPEKSIPKNDPNPASDSAESAPGLDYLNSGDVP